MVEETLKKDFSPEKIVGECSQTGTECVSIERIYQHVWQDKQNGGTLFKHLRSGCLECVASDMEARTAEGSSRIDDR